MSEIGIHLRQKVPTPVQELRDDEFDYVITLGENTSGQRLNFQRGEVVHWNFDDPIAGSNDPEKQLRAFRMVRDQIAQRLRLFVIVHARPHTPAAGITLSRSATAR